METAIARQNLDKYRGIQVIQRIWSWMLTTASMTDLRASGIM